MKTKCAAAALTLFAVMILTASVAGAQTYTVLHHFQGLPAGDGERPYHAGLVMDREGNLYGTTNTGGTVSSAGTVFKLDTSGNLSLLHSFTFEDGAAPDGGAPMAGLVLDREGNLYGTAAYGGSGCSFGCGTVFKMDRFGGNFSVLHRFGSTDGASPQAGLIMDAEGNLYGTTEQGGANGMGTVFKLDKFGGNFSVLHSFSGADGAWPIWSRLVMDTADNLYGTTDQGGANGMGTVFKLDRFGGNFRVLFSFSQYNGMSPHGGLVLDAGYLYGTTSHGGGPIQYDGLGTVFKLDTSGGNFSRLHTFREIPPYEGGWPEGGLVMDAGYLYGTAGLVFKLDPSQPPSSNFSVLYRFPDYHAAGGQPTGELIMDAAGNLYGTTSYGGTYEKGVVFKLSLPYRAQVQQPINPDGLSEFKSGRGVVPVKFTLASDGVQTCILPDATISVHRISDGSSTPVEEDSYTMPADFGSNFRIDQGNCQYVYNLAARGLGEGTYQAKILIDGAVVGAARFTLR